MVKALQLTYFLCRTIVVLNNFVVCKYIIPAVLVVIVVIEAADDTVGDVKVEILDCGVDKRIVVVEIEAVGGVDGMVVAGVVVMIGVVVVVAVVVVTIEVKSALI